MTRGGQGTAAGHGARCDPPPASDAIDCSMPVDCTAGSGDIPVVDIEDWLEDGGTDSLEALSIALRHASEQVGCYYLTGHGVAETLVQGLFVAARDFFDLPEPVRSAIRTDRSGWPVGGCGYFPFGQRRRPEGIKANPDQAFLVKQGPATSLDQNQWPDQESAPAFRSRVETYALALERLSLALLPAYAHDLGVPLSTLDAVSARPTWSLRLKHYPVIPETEIHQYGIAAHVDDSFFTILAQNRDGLVIESRPRGCWMHVPRREGAFIVNTGESLRRWSGGRYASLRHFARNDGAQPRCSIPFFFYTGRDGPQAAKPS